MDLSSAESLIQAIQNRDFDRVKSLLLTQISSGYSINQPLPDPPFARQLAWTPLFWAVLSGDEQILTFFLSDLKANPNITDSDGHNPAHLAVRVQDRSSMLRSLALFGCDVTANDGYGMNIVEIAGMNYGIGVSPSEEKVRNARDAFVRGRIYQKLFILFVRSNSPGFLQRVPNPLIRDLFDYLIRK